MNIILGVLLILIPLVVSGTLFVRSVGWREIRGLLAAMFGGMGVAIAIMAPICAGLWLLGVR